VMARADRRQEAPGAHDRAQSRWTIS
jgi:hypothetical protein